MNKIVLINLLPNDRMVLRHFRRLEHTIRLKMLNPVMVQPNHRDALRRVLSLPADLFYLVGHATPSEGIHLRNDSLGWLVWSQLYHQALPLRLIFNICYSQPGVYWQINTSSSLEVIGHHDLVDRTWAMEWGKDMVEKIIGFE